MATLGANIDFEKLKKSVLDLVSQTTGISKQDVKKELPAVQAKLSSISRSPATTDVVVPEGSPAPKGPPVPFEADFNPNEAQDAQAVRKVEEEAADTSKPFTAKSSEPIEDRRQKMMDLFGAPKPLNITEAGGPSSSDIGKGGMTSTQTAIAQAILGFAPIIIGGLVQGRRGGIAGAKSGMYGLEKFETGRAEAAKSAREDEELAIKRGYYADLASQKESELELKKSLVKTPEEKELLKQQAAMIKDKINNPEKYRNKPQLTPGQQAIIDEKKRNRFVIGLGYASTVKDAELLRQMKIAVDTAQPAVAKLLEINKLPWYERKNYFSKSYGDAKSLNATLQGAARAALNGPGPMTENDRAVLKEAIHDPSSLWATQQGTEARLNTYLEVLNRVFESHKSVMLEEPLPQAKASSKSESAPSGSKNTNNSDNNFTPVSDEEAAKALKALQQKKGEKKR